jgi:hypothetical protein
VGPDPILAAAIVDVRRALKRARSRWQPTPDAEDLAQLARTAVEHLEADRFDEAVASAIIVAELDAEAKSGAWQEFAILVEEAAACAPAP